MEPAEVLPLTPTLESPSIEPTRNRTLGELLTSRSQRHVMENGSKRENSRGAYWRRGARAGCGVRPSVPPRSAASDVLGLDVGAKRALAFGLVTNATRGACSVADPRTVERRLQRGASRVDRGVEGRSMLPEARRLNQTNSGLAQLGRCAYLRGERHAQSLAVVV
jgi:hypothetical protein